MAKFKLTSGTTVAELKKEFKASFNSSLKVYNKNKVAEESATLAELGLNADAEIECRANLTVGSFIKRMAGNGLKVKVFTQDEWVSVLPGLTLESSGKLKNQATLSDQQNMIAYQRENKIVIEDDFIHQGGKLVVVKVNYDYVLELAELYLPDGMTDQDEIIEFAEENAFDWNCQDSVGCFSCEDSLDNQDIAIEIDGEPVDFEKDDVSFEADSCIEDDKISSDLVYASYRENDAQYTFQFELGADQEFEARRLYIAPADEESWYYIGELEDDEKAEDHCYDDDKIYLEKDFVSSERGELAHVVIGYEFIDID